MGMQTWLTKIRGEYLIGWGVTAYVYSHDDKGQLENPHISFTLYLLHTPPQ